ncbi:hypothetical protein F5Y14DRAFT_428124 [Nemania sp. NC0429]|nr:hypothetical protein F5Y14DRAFT_428124 [Nemania sp. NC0429]
MDPVSAVGVAAAAIQFLDASVKAYNAYKEICDSSWSSTARNKQLEDNIRAARGLWPSIAASNSQRSTDPVSELRARCASKADKLLEVLEYVRGQRKKINRLQATVRARKKSKLIEQLHTALKEDRATLDHIVNQKLLPQIDHLTVLQTREFANQDSRTQQLISELVQQRNAQQASNAAIQDKLDGLQRDINDGHISFTDQINNFHRNVQCYFDEAEQLRRREELLKSLYFPEIDLRRNSIKAPASDTLDCLFSSSDHIGARSRWPSFRQWLREDTSMYWISGKAGSGKSTLMAHIVEDTRTLQDLAVWKNGDDLEILSFFFWRAGSDLQKNIRGLLRSLLYQLCRLKLSISDAVSSRLSSPPGMFPIWTELDLLGHITEAIKAAQSTRFCIFIDGLDEFQDPNDGLNSLIDNLNRLQDLGNVKVCVSSRPELALVNRLHGLKQLRLQDLNKDDISKFVHQSFLKRNLSDDDRDRLVEEVVRRAEGVFLWASLVTHSLIRGLQAHDDPDMMQARLDLLPTDMNKLFEQMLSNVDEVHRESLALYVQLMMLKAEDNRIGIVTGIPIVAMLQLRDPINSYEEFANECERKVIQIESRSAGLLQSSVEAGLEQETIINDQPCFNPKLPQKPQQLNRRPCDTNHQHSKILDYHAQRMEWIHRSAFEFFSGLNEQKPQLLKPSFTRKELLRRISESLVSYIGAAPDLNQKDVIDVCTIVSMWYDDNPTEASAVLDELYFTCLQLSLDEIGDSGNDTVIQPAFAVYGRELLFWNACAFAHQWSYILSRAYRISIETTPDFAILMLLLFMIDLAMCFVITDESFIQLINTLAEFALQQKAKKYEVGNATHMRFDPELRWNGHGHGHGNFDDHVSWKEPISSESTTAMAILPCIVGVYTYVQWKTSPRPELPKSLIALIEMTDLYMPVKLKSERIYVQISATDWIKMINQRITKVTFDAYTVAASVSNPIRVVCVPSIKLDGLVDTSERAIETPPEGVLATQKLTRLVFLDLSLATSDKIVSLLGFGGGDDTFRVRIHLNLNRQQRGEVCEMILQEIGSETSGLNEAQRVIAATCVREGLLND